MTGVGSVVGGRIHRYMMINHIVICVFISLHFDISSQGCRRLHYCNNNISCKYFFRNHIIVDSN